MREGTVTRNYRQSLRKIASRPAMQEYLCANNKWTNSEFEWIDWDSHGISIRKWYHKKHFVTKLLHDWLPFGSLLSKYKPTYSAKCPSCECEMEDRDHFLRCPGRHWKGDLFDALRKYLDRNKTRPALDDILNECLRSWLSGQEICLTGYPVLYNRLIRNQFVIGWKQLFFGRFVKEWAELQDDHLAKIRNGDRKLTGRIWVTGVITLIWDHLYVNWEERNAALHGHDANTREAAMFAQAQRETENLYGIREQVLSRDKDLFYTTIDTHYEKETTARGLRQWLNTWKPVILHSVAESKKFGLRGVNVITQYFQNTLPDTDSATNPDS
jgi:hypothetical protein